MKNAWRVLCIATSAVAIAACSNQLKATPQATPGGPLLGLISASVPLPLHGGALTLSDGSAVIVRKGTLSRGQTVTAVHDLTAVAPAPNAAWLSIPGTLTVRFQYPLIAALVPPTPPPHRHPPSPARLPTAVRLAIPYTPASGYHAVQTVIVTAGYPNGTTRRFGLPGRLDAAHGRIETDVPSALAGGATSLQLSLAADAPGYVLPSPGPRYWTGTQWSSSGTIDPNKRTLVFVHGIFSSVESAFPCAQQILDAGGYQQGVGLDYNWTDPPQVEGPVLAAFLNSLAKAGLTSFDIEAHSYGSVVTYAALPSVHATMPHVVTLGGPLPLEGTPLAEGPLLRLVLVALADVFVGPPSLIDHAYASGMVASMATDSSELQAIEIGVRGMKAKPEFIQVAGTSEYPDEAYLYPILYFYITYPWDGIVEQIAATSTDIPGALPKSFPLEHTQLECTPAVIDYVGAQVHPPALRL